MGNTERKKHAYTIIELCTSLSLLVGLSALLFSVSSRIRVQSRRTICASNLQQIHLATVQYSRDYANRFPMGNAFWDRNLPIKYLANVMKPYAPLEKWDCPAWQHKYKSDDPKSPGNYSFITGKNGVVGFSRLIGEPKRASSWLYIRNPSAYPLFFCGSAPKQVPNGFQMNAHSSISDQRWQDGKQGGTSILFANGSARFVKCAGNEWDEIYSTLP